jgi:23S rRNA pseudouridine2605 synthase
LISVNGKTITELGTKVSPGDEVKYNGERIRNERKVYLLLNKPKDYVTTTADPKERKTVMQLIRDACTERIYPVGRLDRNTTGVLLFTNDGDLAKKLTHPSHNKKKIYHVFLDKGLSGGDLKKLAEGITLEDGFIQPDAINYASDENKNEVGLEIHSGKNRIVRRMFESLDYRIRKLDRVYFAGLTKKNLPRGKWRLLTEKEVTRLKMNAYE